MKRVNIYINISPASIRKSKKRYGFVLECVINDFPYTKDQFGEVEDTYNGAVLKVINSALRRMNQSCEVHVYTDNTYILGMIEKNLDMWAGNGFVTSKGEPLKNQEEWRNMWSLSMKHLLVPEPGKHPFSEWINGILTNDTEFEKRGKENV